MSRRLSQNARRAETRASIGFAQGGVSLEGVSTECGKVYPAGDQGTGVIIRDSHRKRDFQSCDDVFTLATGMPRRMAHVPAL